MPSSWFVELIAFHIVIDTMFSVVVVIFVVVVVVVVVVSFQSYRPLFDL